MSYGGIAAVHRLVTKLGLVNAIDTLRNISNRTWMALRPQSTSKMMKKWHSGTASAMDRS